VTCWNVTNYCLCCQQFVYINSAFSPNPDELVVDLYNVRFLPKMYLHQFFLNLYSKIDVSIYFFCITLLQHLIVPEFLLVVCFHICSKVDVYQNLVT